MRVSRGSDPDCNRHRPRRRCRARLAGVAGRQCAEIGKEPTSVEQMAPKSPMRPEPLANRRASMRERINNFFDLLELLVVRLTLLILLVLGAYTLIRGHP